MREELCRQLVSRASNDRMVFLTGDLGFMALEPLRDAMGARFINCGVAEQNMVTVAAALCREGLEIWVYSIAPFLYARAFEQLRNDICFHSLPVKLLGNGGGYGYGVMGPSHHALEDCGTLLTLPSISVLVPAFDTDIGPVLDRAASSGTPCYVRLGRDERPRGATAPEYAPWRRLLSGNGGVMIGLGPIAGSALAALNDLPSASRPELWVACALPVERYPLPEALTAAIETGRSLAIVEEHVRHGGLGQSVCTQLVERGISIHRFRHLAAQGHSGGRYGSQNFLRERAGLGAEAIRAAALFLSD